MRPCRVRFARGEGMEIVYSEANGGVSSCTVTTCTLLVPYGIWVTLGAIWHVSYGPDILSGKSNVESYMSDIRVDRLSVNVRARGWRRVSCTTGGHHRLALDVLNSANSAVLRGRRPRELRTAGSDGAGIQPKLSVDGISKCPCFIDSI